MKQLVGIRLGRDGQMRSGVNSSGTDLSAGDGVVFEEEIGPFFGRVLWQRAYAEQPCQHHCLPEVRPATEEECSQAESNEELREDAFRYCRECIIRRELDMKLVGVDVLLDRSKVIFYFTAPTRIDFRELVKDLVRQYRTRIELRQIGVRHETQKLGALGNCGMVVCCRRYLSEFAPVTIKMAKEQNLFLNPTKISGICGRLLCCLSFEQDNYDSFHRSSPKLGKRYQTDRGWMRVLRASMFRNTVTVVPDGGQEEEMSLEEWQALSPRRTEHGGGQPRAETTPYTYTVISASPESLESDLAELEDEESQPKQRHGRGNR